MNKKKESKVVPNVRFKGFTDDWKQCKLNEVLSFLKDGTHGTHADDENGPLLLSAKNIKNGKIICDETDRRISEEEYEKIHTNFSLEVGDVLLTIVGSIGETAILKDCSSITFQRSVAFLRPNGTITSDFLYSEIQTQKFQNELDSRKSTSAQPGIYLGDLSEVPIVFTTNLDEQTKIGDYFNNLDHLITLHQQKITLLIKLKKVMLEKMFPKKGTIIPEFRFNGFANAWEQRKLENLGKATGGTSIESEFSEDGIYKVISIGSYSENSVYNDQGIRAIKSDKTSNRVLNKNDLTMILNDKTTSGNIIGRVLLIEKSGIYVYNQRTERIEININEYDPVFLYEMLNAPNIREKIIKQAQGNTQIYVNWSTIAMLDYMIPSKKEQVKIGQFLHSISNIITLHQRKIYKIKNMKKAMLDQMFI